MDSEAKDKLSEEELLAQMGYVPVFFPALSPFSNIP